MIRPFELEQADTAAWELVDKRALYRCSLHQAGKVKDLGCISQANDYGIDRSNLDRAFAVLIIR